MSGTPAPCSLLFTGIDGVVDAERLLVGIENVVRPGVGTGLFDFLINAVSGPILSSTVMGLSGGASFPLPFRYMLPGIAGRDYDED